MKWWHRWRYRVWYFRYLTARGELYGMHGAEHTLKWKQIECERATAVSACEYHHAKAGL